MSKPITAEDKLHVQQHIKNGQEERIFHNQDVEALGVIAGKHDREKQAQEAAAKRFRERMAEHQRRYQEREEELRRQEEAWEAQRAENLKGLRKAIILAGFLCGIGGMHLVGAWRPDFAMVAGGVIILSGLLVIGGALTVYCRQ